MILIVVLLVPLYFALLAAGASEAAAAFWTPAVAAVPLAWLTWRRAHSAATPAPPPMSRGRLASRTLALALLSWLVSSVVAGVVGGFVPPPADDPAHSVAMSLRYSTLIGLPIVLELLFRLGHRSARWLPARRPLRWLAVVSVVPALISIALHPVAVAFSSANGSTPTRDLSDILPRAVVVTVLYFCALALGNLQARSRLSDQGPLGSA
ncbi:hypothetical protein AB0M02_38550 [Actinoplanes sp. NPDC051861]|uniref:hypothetical protein n=1 Tax=Actinoplanes sp. NPDC051861 TaxID=3155170 RepID=UPI003446FE30